MNASRATPHFLSQLADRARYGMDTLVRRDPDPRLPAEPDETVRRSAVLVLVAGSGLDDAQLVLEERGHALRSQPGQFSLPGGKADPTDRDAVHTAMREAHEETGLDPGDVSVLGSFAEIPMPWRAQRVTPVLAWAPHRPQLRVQDPIEVERLVWAPLTGAGSLTDPRRRMRGILHGQPVGPVFDLPEGALVWGFTAMIVEQVLTGLGLDPVPLDAPVLEIPPERRR
ncbi:MAG TPA: CoA pyrophosphatase [Candidatus Brachybacterium merdavium]|uniref:CoA pyrophosphatase n=1 Tax=Candidatus Brachybacterium merdavium TaxID=2838513 RepID=A0A9D2LDG9_9MICO|nr:CoA pyrophosphatase [Candidatus Brachybacterium merdavium]